MIRFFLIIILLFIQGCSSTPLAKKDDYDNVRYPSIRKELLKMKEADQAISFKLLNHKNESYEERYQELTTRHTDKLKKIMYQHNILRSEDIGKDGLAALIQLVSHISDIEFQEKMLHIIEKLNAQGDITGQEYASLYDQVQFSKGDPQYYGTLLLSENDHYVLVNIKDPEYVDQRRATLGLSSLSEYLKLFSRSQDKIN